MIIKIVNGILKENAYLIGEDDCYIIDPGQFHKLIIDKVNENFKGVKAILLTHGHFDHCNCVDKLVEYFKCPVYLSEFDTVQIDGSLVGHYKLGKYICTLNSKTIDAIKLADPNVVVYETPGHTKGSVCYYFKKENILFSGDTLFYESVGRSDLPGGNSSDLKDTLKTLISLKDDIIVYPGHDKETTIGHEKEYNKYIKLI